MSLKSSTKTDVNTTELVISIDADAFEAAVEKEYQRQKKNIQIKGFRKGKVTRKLAEKEFGEGAFYEGAINSLLRSLRLTQQSRRQVLFSLTDPMLR